VSPGALTFDHPWVIVVYSFPPFSKERISLIRPFRVHPRPNDFSRPFAYVRGKKTIFLLTNCCVLSTIAAHPETTPGNHSFLFFTSVPSALKDIRVRVAGHSYVYHRLFGSVFTFPSGIMHPASVPAAELLDTDGHRFYMIRQVQCFLNLKKFLNHS